jgi:hypothetical protein
MLGGNDSPWGCFPARRMPRNDATTLPKGPIPGKHPSAYAPHFANVWYMLLWCEIMEKHFFFFRKSYQTFVSSCRCGIPFNAREAAFDGFQ